MWYHKPCSRPIIYIHPKGCALSRPVTPTKRGRPTPDAEEEALAAPQRHRDALLIKRGKAKCPVMLRR
jgi:hypothetical protein